MSRVGTPNLGMGTWLQGEHPGAGSQTEDNLGLNGNWLKIDTAVGLQHNPDGTHKAGVITGANLNANVADGTTLQKNGSNQLEVKDAGITGAKLAAGVADGSTLQKNGSDQLEVKDAGITAAKLKASGSGKVVDDVTIGINGSGELFVKTTSLSTQLAHDNTRTKDTFQVILEGAGNTYCKVGGLLMTSGLGIVLPRAGAVTKVTLSKNDGSVQTVVRAYNTSPPVTGTHFNANDRLTVNASGNSLIFSINGTAMADFQAITDAGSNRPWIIVIEVEYD